MVLHVYEIYYTNSILVLTRLLPDLGPYKTAVTRAASAGKRCTSPPPHPPLPFLIPVMCADAKQVICFSIFIHTQCPPVHIYMVRVF